MENYMNQIASTIIVLMTISLISCNNSGVVPGPSVTHSRNVSIDWRSDPSGDALMTIGALLDIDPVSPRDDRDDWLQKVEINGGSGLNWIDVTQYYREFLDSDLDWNYISGYKYTYVNTGTYILSARATFWDGEVVYSGGTVVTVPHAAP
jgi:hypothetical protein